MTQTQRLGGEKTHKDEKTEEGDSLGDTSPGLKVVGDLVLGELGEEGRRQTSARAS